MWDKFLDTIINCFCPHGLREAKAKKFINLKQRKKSLKEYALKFHQFSFYTPNLVSRKKVRIRKFASGLSWDLLLECKAVILNSEIDISRLEVYIQ